MLSREYPTLSVLALSVDGPAPGPAVRNLAFAKAPGLTVLHPERSGLAAKLSVSALPRTFLFDATGTLVWSSTGALRGDDPEFVLAINRVEVTAESRR